MKDFRGKYVLLDFWIIGCGPCIRDFPNVSLAQELYGGDHFTVVSVHTNSQPMNQVKQFTDTMNLKYPVVVDNAAGEILKAYGKLGVDSYPNYLLIDPDGKVVENDNFPSTLSLRNHKLEVIHKYWLLANQRSKEKSK